MPRRHPVDSDAVRRPGAPGPGRPSAFRDVSRRRRLAPSPASMTIPEVRDRLRELADQHGIPELHRLADELYRRRHREVAQTARSMRPGMAAAIRRYAYDHPEASELDVANVFGVNQGRVSESLYGKRT